MTAGAATTGTSPPVGPEAAGRSGAPVLELRGVRAGYGAIEVLHGVDIAVRPGRVVALLGPNGVGKSTTLKVASGLVVVHAGCVHVAGRHVNGVGPDALARAGVRSVPEGRGVFANLSVAENLKVVAGAGRRHFEEIAYSRFPRLGERRHQLAGTLSGGEQQMLALSRALVSGPRLLLVDELSMGLAPVLVESLYAEIQAIAREGVAVLLVEQFAHGVLGVADHAALMLQGRIVAAGPPADLVGVLEEVYLGGYQPSDDRGGSRVHKR